MKNWVLSYLDRIGMDYQEPSLDYLKQLQRAHMLSVPFENTAIMVKSSRNDKSLSLDVDSLVQKIVVQRKGGFCYELNGMFGELLRELGFHVTNMAALMMGDDDYLPDAGIIDHMTLAVDFPEGRYYTDVGAGNSNRIPLRKGEEIEDIGGRYRIAELDSPRIAHGLDTEYTLALQKYDEDWKLVYIFSEKPFTLQDYHKSCYWMETTTKSHFTERLLVSIATPNGRKTISSNRFTQTEGNQITKTELQNSQLKSILAKDFGITDMDPPFGRTTDWHKIT